MLARELAGELDRQDTGNAEAFVCINGKLIPISGINVEYHNGKYVAVVNVDVDARHYFSVLYGDEDFEATLCVHSTDEGIIADVVDDEGNIIKTWGATAQEIADELCS